MNTQLKSFEASNSVFNVNLISERRDDVYFEVLQKKTGLSWYPFLILSECFAYVFKKRIFPAERFSPPKKIAFLPK